MLRGGEKGGDNKAHFKFSQIITIIFLTLI
ncbi:hypothetical protein N411_03515 [Helicobacter pylori FD535]|nr:hypothetical protein N411_03515 [Helicobacter pylori FD535]